MDIEDIPAPAPAPPEPEITKAGDALELASKAIITLVGLCYAIGLVVRNIHLSRYGYYTVGLLELNYIMAGVWALLPMFLGVLLLNLLSFLFFIDDEAKPHLRRGKKAKLTGYDIFVNVFVSVLLAAGFLLVSHRYLALPLSWGLVGTTLLGILALYFLAATAYFSVSPSGFNFSTRLLFATCGIILLGLYLSLFARRHYNDIPSGVGGGRPELVRLVPAEEAKPYLVTLGLRLDGTGNVTEPTQMILATENELVLSTGASGVAAVPRDAVKALIFEKQ